MFSILAQGVDALILGFYPNLTNHLSFEDTWLQKKFSFLAEKGWAMILPTSFPRTFPGKSLGTRLLF